jgi:hypothetical protein
MAKCQSKQRRVLSAPYEPGTAWGLKHFMMWVDQSLPVLFTAEATKPASAMKVNLVE